MINKILKDHKINPESINPKVMEILEKIYEVGKGDGWVTGYDCGKAEGYNEGYNEGYDEGFDEGYIEGGEF